MTDDHYIYTDFVHLFVYGTMKQGFRNHARISSEYDSCYLGDYITQQAAFSMKSKTANGHPAPVVLPDGAHQIAGELYRIDKSLLDYIDLMEGHPVVYKRVPVLLKGAEQSVWMYLVESDEPVFSSDYVEIEGGIASFTQ